MKQGGNAVQFQPSGLPRVDFNFHLCTSSYAFSSHSLSHGAAHPLKEIQKAVIHSLTVLHHSGDLIYHILYH